MDIAAFIAFNEFPNNIWQTMKLYIHRDGQQLGPYSEDEVRSYLADGRLQPSDLAWHKGTPDWQPLSSLAEFSRQSAPPSRPSPAPTPASSPVNLPKISAASLGAYARSTLQSNETPLYKTSVHWVIFLFPGFIAVLLLSIGLLTLFLGKDGFDRNEDLRPVLIISAVVLFLFFVLSLAQAIITYITSELVITNRRVLIKVGFVQRRTLEMFISKIESVGVNQGILDRVLDCGTVTVRGTGGSAEPFNSIAHPIQFRNCVQRIQSQPASGQ